MYIVRERQYQRDQAETRRRWWKMSRIEAAKISRLMRNKLAQLGLDYIFQMDGEKVRRKPKVELIEISPDQFRMKIDSNRLPYGVSEHEMTKEEVVKGLEATVSLTCYAHLGIEGLWYILDRKSGWRDVPFFVKFADVFNQLTSRDGPLTIPIGQRAGRVCEKIDLESDASAHFLIGGATGQGKTTLIHLILSTLIQQPPDRVRLLLVDLKGTEFLPYQELPHLHIPVVTELEQVSDTVDTILEEVMARKRMLQEVRYNDIKKYNRRAQPKKRVPYLVCVFDEIAEAMLHATGKEKKHIESRLARIAAIGRAVGVHLIVATQKPSSDVLTRLITANFPGRIALACATVYDSMTIIGDGSACFAERDVPRGRAILGYGRHRVPLQCAYIADGQRDQIVSDVMGGKIGRKRMYHDVTMQELHEYCVNTWPAEDASFVAWFKQVALYQQFADRRISQPDIKWFYDTYQEQPYIYDGDKYMLVGNNESRKSEALRICLYNDGLQPVVSEQQNTEPDYKQQVLELHAEGVNNTEIQMRVFGSKSGRNYKKVKAIIGC